MVGLGTQQFTVLALHDRWVELTPRANLRHFPDMARCTTTPHPHLGPHLGPYLGPYLVLI